LSLEIITKNLMVDSIWDMNFVDLIFGLDQNHVYQKDIFKAWSIKRV